MGIKTVRKYFNRVGRYLDRSSLDQVHTDTSVLDEPAEPVTAAEAFQRALEFALRLDAQARLVRITASGSFDGKGRSSRWEFFFDLPKRRAEAEIDWLLPWDEQSDSYGRPRIDGKAKPFPVPGSLLYRSVGAGDLLYRQLDGLWRKELERRGRLPYKFRNSDEALRDFVDQGLDPAVEQFTLSAETGTDSPPQWIVRTRHKAYTTTFAVT